MKSRIASARSSGNSFTQLTKEGVWSGIWLMRRGRQRTHQAMGGARPSKGRTWSATDASPGETGAPSSAAGALRPAGPWREGPNARRSRGEPFSQWLGREGLPRPRLEAGRLGKTVHGPGETPQIRGKLHGSATLISAGPSSRNPNGRPRARAALPQMVRYGQPSLAPPPGLGEDWSSLCTP